MDNTCTTTFTPDQLNKLGELLSFFRVSENLSDLHKNIPALVDAIWDDIFSDEEGEID